VRALVVLIFLLVAISACSSTPLPEEIAYKIVSEHDLVDNGTVDKAKLLTLETRPGIEVDIAVIEPADSSNPTADLLLFAGGGGVVNMTSDGDTLSIPSGNFLIRSRSLFTLSGVRVILVDAPSDRHGSDGMKGGFRNSENHRYDIDAIVKYISDETGLHSTLPLWLVGTSRGTESAAYLAIKLERNFDGVVLTSPITRTNSIGKSVLELDLASISEPMLITVHEQDACINTPPSGGEQIEAAAAGSSSALLMRYNGGSNLNSDPCSAGTYHGYLDIESQVVSDIVDFINQNAP
jgi:pimeloyl-ACP methyl ester carboxylesterase